MAMDVIHPRVAGIDVHNKVICVAVRLPGTEPAQREVPVRRVRTVGRQLRAGAGRRMSEALVAGDRGPARVTGLAKGVLRRKTDALAMACDGRFTPGHAQMCRLHLDAHDHLTAQIAALDVLVAEAAAPFAALIA